VVRQQCNAKPSSAVAGAGSDVFDTLRNSLATIDWQAWLLPLVWVVAILLVIIIGSRFVCPRTDEGCIKPKVWAYALTILVGILAIGLLGGATLLFIERDTYQAFVGITTVIATGVLAICLLLFALAMAYGLVRPSPCTLQIGFGILLLLTICEILLSLLCMYWVYSLGLVPGDALDSMFGVARTHIDSFLSTILDQPVAVAEGIVCKTYQTCCMSPALALYEHDSASGITDGVDGGAQDTAGFYNESSSGVADTVTMPPVYSNRSTCLAPSQHQGVGTDLELTLHDPSTENFCAYTSGAPAHLLIAPPLGTCLLLEELSGSEFVLDSCKAKFCESGIDGYIEFVSMFVRMLQKYGWPIAAGFATLVVLQMILACNLRRVALLARSKQRKASQIAYIEGNLKPVYSERV